MGQENSSGSQKLCYINAHGQEECFRNEYTSTNDYHMGFDLVSKNHAQRGMVLQNLLEEEEDKLKIFGNTLVTKEQLMQKLPDNHCFKAHISDEHQSMHEWICHHDLQRFWKEKCIMGVCDEVEELHKLFLGQCVEVLETQVCPGEIKDLAHMHHSELGLHERIMGDRVWGISQIGRCFRGSRCLKVSNTFICDDDVEHILNTGCIDIHAHDQNGHHEFKVCDGKLADLLEGQLISVDGGHLLKAHYSSEFTDLGDICI